jgi:trans-aconitate 2-methyltransferase
LTARDWDAATYARLSGPLTAMGSEVLDRLVLRGDETVLDAGCGTGNVTRLLLERLEPAAAAECLRRAAAR